MVIFNWKDSLQVDRMLNLLGVLARAAQGIESNSESTKVFGHLHMYVACLSPWILTHTTIAIVCSETGILLI